MGVKIDYENNADEIVKESNEKVKQILYAIGLKWQKIATDLITKVGIVDSGRLRGSLTFVTFDKIGKPTKRVKENKKTDFLSGTSGDEDSVIVGSNVEYAAKQEFTNKKGAFLRPSLTDYKESYNNIIKEMWQK